MRNFSLQTTLCCKRTTLRLAITVYRIFQEAKFVQNKNLPYGTDRQKTLAKEFDSHFVHTEKLRKRKLPKTQKNAKPSAVVNTIFSKLPNQTSRDTLSPVHDTPKKLREKKDSEFFCEALLFNITKSSRNAETFRDWNRKIC